jgi:HTH-type transcriptional regulator/antitoxin HipB
MAIRTPRDLGAAVRDRRRALQLDQAALASRAGVSRQWIIALERGKPGAELGLVLRTLKALDLRLDVNAEPTTVTGSADINLDAIVAAAREPK